MIRLKDKFKGKAALNIMGGPSILEKKFDLGRINKDKYVVFLETKALTPRFLDYGLSPGYFLAFFPEKCQTNSFQHVIYQSFLADIELSRLIKEEYLGEYCYFKDNFKQYFEPWNPEKNIPFKKFRWRKDIILKNSPIELMAKLPDTAFITRHENIEKYAGLFGEGRNIYVYRDKPVTDKFSLIDYFTPYEEEKMTVIKSYDHLNSAAIALFPLLRYLGFKKIYFIGMDMSMLGSMEYSALYTFKSLKHFAKFFKKAIPVFSSSFRENKKKFMRPVSEFNDLARITQFDELEFINIYEPFEFALPMEGVRNITFEEFLNE